MTTVRQIGGLLSDGHNRKLFAELSRYRADVPEPLISELSASPLATAAMAAIRLQELTQTHTPVYKSLVQRLLASQESTGGWGSTLVTVLATRALLNDPGTALAAARRGLALLTQLQKEDGSLPRETVRRLPGDAIATAFTLAHLARAAGFADRFRLEAAIHSLTDARATVPPAMHDFIRLALQRASTGVGGQAAKLVGLAMTA